MVNQINLADKATLDSVNSKVDTTVSSRASQTTVDAANTNINTVNTKLGASTDAANSGGTTLFSLIKYAVNMFTSYWTPIRAGNLDRLDTAISSRATPADVTSARDSININMNAKHSETRSIILNQLNDAHGCKHFTSNGNFTVPSGVTSIFVTACAAGANGFAGSNTPGFDRGGGGGGAASGYGCGGGGGGGPFGGGGSGGSGWCGGGAGGGSGPSGYASGGGAGGAGGAYVINKQYTVVPGEVLTITVGYGNTTIYGTQSGTLQTLIKGTGTSFKSNLDKLIVSPGGGGGGGGSGSNSSGGAGGGPGGATIHNGGNCGEPGKPGSPGESSIFGAGGVGGAAGFGGGGGSGGPGIVIIEW
ncbi:hypothetical protein Desru_1326 [Desulforamulus ruminis DSM 2154]|uniref:Uncharacterized protein n=1 Tax=Desulforamulus ruminis (strain ATCC 23193 / DSM 2154 / NCIMB 8452 / DL) TaxID=696281 RepID=F6DPM3_DESRL|nr:hypothetical protein Desru_1326 [Desulforamulus ruminis DSM 2154]